MLSNLVCKVTKVLCDTKIYLIFFANFLSEVFNFQSFRAKKMRGTGFFARSPRHFCRFSGINIPSSEEVPWPVQSFSPLP